MVLMTKAVDSLDNEIVVDIRLEDPGAVPPRYFMQEDVLTALYEVIRHDVVVNGAPVPAGCAPLWGQPTLTEQAIAKAQKAGQSVKFHATDLLPPFIAALLLALLFLFGLYLLGGLTRW